MVKTHSGSSSDPKASKPLLSTLEIDYSPKTYTHAETFLFGVKLFAVSALFLGLMCLAEWYSG